MEYARRLSSGRSAIDTRESPGLDQSANETIMLGLRTMKGLNLVQFGRIYGPELLRRFERNAVALTDAGILRIADGCAQLTDRGILLSDEALTRLSA